MADAGAADAAADGARPSLLRGDVRSGLAAVARADGHGAFARHLGVGHLHHGLLGFAATSLALVPEPGPGPAQG